MLGLLRSTEQYDKDPNLLAKSIQARSDNDAQVVVAILHGKAHADAEVPGVTMWNRDRIAELVEKHSSRLPIARTFGL